MTSYARWAFALALLPVAACSSNSALPPVAAAPPPPTLAMADSTFLNGTAAEEATEVSLSQLAATKARAPRIRTYAASVVKGHTASDQQLSTLAQSKGFTPDATMSSDQQAMMAKLQADRPAQFDRDYLHDMVVLNQASLNMIKDEGTNGQDADAKAFAQQSMTQQQQHLRMARSLGGR